MTTLIAYQGDDFCAFAADSQTTMYDMASDCSPMGKIAKNGDYVIAAAGLVRGMNIMQHGFTPPKPPKTKNILAKFMVAKFIPALRKSFIASGYDMKDDGDIASQDNDIIVGVNGQLFFIDEAYGLEYVADHLYCGGSGTKLALGAAYALGGENNLSQSEAIEVLVKAVRTAIRYDVYSSGKVQVVVQRKDGTTTFDFAE